MIDTPLTADDFFKQDQKDLPDSDKFFSDISPLPIREQLEITGGMPFPPANIARKFDSYFDEAFGNEPLGLSEDNANTMRKYGVYNNYAAGENNVIKGLMEAVVVPAADQVARSFYAGFRGVQGALYQTGVELGSPALGRDLAMIPEAFPVGLNTYGTTPYFAKAKVNGILDGEKVYMGTVEPTAVQLRDRSNIASQILPSEAASAYQSVQEIIPVSLPPTVSKAARLESPNTFNTFDLAGTRQDLLRRGIENLKAERMAQIQESAPHTAEIAELQKKLEGANKRKAKIYQEKIDDLTEKNRIWADEQTSGYTPEMIELQKGISDLDLQRRNLATEISQVTKKAENSLITQGDYDIPNDEWSALKEVGLVNVADDGSETVRLGDYWSEKSKRQKMLQDKIDAEKTVETTEIAALKEPVISEPVSATESVPTPVSVSAPITKESLKEPAVSEPVIAPEPPSPLAPAALVRPVEDQVRLIAADIEKQAVAAGYDLEASQAASQILARQYAYIGQMYGRTAEEIYQTSGARITSKTAREEAKKTTKEAAQGARAKKVVAGSYKAAADSAQAVIRIFKTSDRSTLIHEGAHHFLSMMKRFESEASIPAALKEDMSKIRSWLKVKEDGVFTRAMEEKFARGFERYLMEGVSPSKDLAIIFSKFKTWLTDIYKAVKNIPQQGGGINDDIRSFFDKTLTTGLKNEIIDSKLEFGASAAAHEADSFKTPDKYSASVADNIKSDRYITARTHDPEVADAIESAEIGSDTAGASKNQRNAQSTAIAGQDGFAPKPEEIGSGGGGAEIQGVKAREPGVTSSNSELSAPESLLVDKAGNIRLDNLNSPEDIKQLLRETASGNGMFLEQRRGVVSDADVEALANALGMDAQLLNTRKTGQAFNAEEIKAAQRLLLQSADETRNLMNKAKNGSESDVLAYLKAKERHIMIQGHFSGITAESGRALRALRKTENVKDAELLGQFLEQQTGRTIDELRQEAARGATLDTTQKISKYIHDSTKPGFKDMALEFWVNSILSSPMTHAKNIIGNGLVAFNSAVEGAVASQIGKAFKAATKKEAEKVLSGEAKARLFGIMQGAKNGIRAAGVILKNEDAITGFHTVEYVHHKKAISGVKGKIIRMPTRLLAAEDEIFKAIGYQQELNALAYRTAHNEGLVGDALNQRIASLMMNPTEEIMKLAIKNAEYQTFTKKLGPTGAALQRLISTNPLIKFVFPFVRTPTNILKYAGERTPLAVLSKEIRENLSGRNGSIARDTQLARMAIGTTIAVAYSTLASEELVTGSGPSNPQERAMWRMTGKQPYSAKIGNTYYSYEWAEPLSTIAGISADLTEIAKSSEDIDDAASAALASVSKTLVRKMSLRGASDLLQVINDPDRYGERYIENFIAGFVPNLSGTVAKAVDPVARETTGIIDAIKAKIPFVKDSLFPRRDVWGNPITLQDGLGLDIISPIYQSAVNNDPVNQRLIALGIFPSKIDRKIRGVELTDKQYDDLALLAGQTTKMRLDSAIKVSGFDSMPKAVQVKIIDNIIDSSREMARSVVMMKNPDIMVKALDNKRRVITGE